MRHAVICILHADALHAAPAHRNAAPCIRHAPPPPTHTPLTCARIAPSSNSSFTKCTVGPLKRAPLAMTARCTLEPYIPGPPNDGSSPGWMLSIALGYAATRDAGMSFTCGMGGWEGGAKRWEGVRTGRGEKQSCHL
eukprot:363192-Chlamydomonas_euryale.AAC.18